MGESSGYLTLMAGIAGGAEMVCIPEVPFEMEDVVRETPTPISAVKSTASSPSQRVPAPALKQFIITCAKTKHVPVLECA